jgi:hypothetical protein
LNCREASRDDRVGIGDAGDVRNADDDVNPRPRRAQLIALLIERPTADKIA